MTVKLRPKLSDYFEQIKGQKIEGIGTESGDLIMFLSNGIELCVWSDDSLNLTVSETQMNDAEA